jgi:hypothetical protein
MLNGYLKWQDDMDRHNAIITQTMEDDTTMVQLSFTHNPRWYEFMCCSSSVYRGDTFRAPLKDVMDYITIVGVKTDATSLMYANMSEFRNKLDKGMKPSKALLGYESMIIACEILAQQKCRLLNYQDVSDSFKTVMLAKKK